MPVDHIKAGVEQVGDVPAGGLPPVADVQHLTDLGQGQPGRLPPADEVQPVEHLGALVADNALTGAGLEVDYRHLPRVVFTSPALAAVGMTERQASAAGIRYDSRVLSLAHVPRAIVNRDTRGFIKMVTDADTGRIIGVTALAQDAGDLAAAGVYMLEAGMTTSQVANLWSPYLTMAEGLKLTAQAFTTDIAKLSCCAA